MLSKHYIIRNHLVQEVLKVISSGGFEVGERLTSQRNLAMQLGVSRNSLREAIRVLETMGILEIRSSNGMYLLRRDLPLNEDVSLWVINHTSEILDILAVREALEIKAIELMPENKINDICNQLKKSLKKINMQAFTADEFRNHDIEFHGIIRNGCGNDLLANICSNINETMFDNKLAQIMVQKEKEKSLEDHEMIVKLLCSGDLEGTGKACKLHFNNAMEFIRELAENP